MCGAGSVLFSAEVCPLQVRVCQRKARYVAFCLFFLLRPSGDDRCVTFLRKKAEVSLLSLFRLRKGCKTLKELLARVLECKIYAYGFLFW